MGLIIRKGVISNLNQSVTMTAKNGNLMSQHSVTFRIDNQAVQLKSGTHNSFSNGDTVTAVGTIKKGVFVIYAIRNETTGARDEAQIVLPVILGICMLALGLPLAIFIIGIPLIFFGARMLYAAYIGHQAKSMLEAN